MVKCGKMLVKTLNKFFSDLLLMDIKNTIFNPKFDQHFLPSLHITEASITYIVYKGM